MEPNQSPIQNNPAPAPEAPQTPPITQMPENLLATPHKSPIVKIAVALIILIVLAVVAFLLLGRTPATEQAAVTQEQQLTEEDILGAELDATANIDSSVELNAIDAEF